MKSFYDILEAKRSATQTIGRAKNKKKDVEQNKKKFAFRVKQKRYQLRNEEDLNEAPLVMSDRDILDTIWKKIKPELEKQMAKGDLEVVNNLARIGRYKITKKGQAKGKSYRYDLKK